MEMVWDWGGRGWGKWLFWDVLTIYVKWHILVKSGYVENMSTIE